MTDLRKFYNILVEDHVKTREFSTIFLKIIEQNSVELLVKTLRDKQSYLLSFMNEHFDFEENIVFPSIISAHNDGLITDRIQTLTKEHGQLLTGVNTMLEIAEQFEEKPLQCKDILFSLTEKMCLLSSKHESEEDQLYSEVLLNIEKPN